MSAETTDPFDSPRIAITRVYTRRGDSGDTSLAGGQRVRKDDLRIDAYGTVDELNSFIGLTRETVLASGEPVAELGAILIRIQHELFNAGSILATLPQDIHPRQARITDADTERLESEMDRMNEGLPVLRSFVLPGGCALNAQLHICRTVCRRAERICISLSDQVDPAIVRYLNRLSDAFFIWSRWASHRLGIPETLWDPNSGSTGAWGRS
jgi:cob(I)alamin adenosyltransferase